MESVYVQGCIPFMAPEFLRGEAEAGPFNRHENRGTIDLFPRIRVMRQESSPKEEDFR